MAGNDAYTKLLIHSDTTDGSTTFNDSSQAANTLNIFGDTHHEVDQKKFGASSIHLDGAGDYITISDANGDFNPVGLDFTIDGWMRATLYGADRRLFCKASSYIAGIDGQRLSFANMGTSQTITGATGLSLDTWYHFAFVQYSGTMHVYLDGTLDASGTSNALTSNTNDLQIARYLTQTSYDFTGYLDELRFSKGIARWTANFTPPTGPYTSVPPLGIPFIAVNPLQPINPFPVLGGV